MHEVLGLTYRNGSFYCTQRGELTKITDTDHDGVADRYDAIYRLTSVATTMSTLMDPSSIKWRHVCYPQRAWIGYGEGLGKWHGWLLKVKEDGTMEPIATGLRSPRDLL